MLQIGDEDSTIKKSNMCMHASTKANLEYTDIRGLNLHFRPIMLFVFENMTQRAIL